MWIGRMCILRDSDLSTMVSKETWFPRIRFLRIRFPWIWCSIMWRGGMGIVRGRVLSTMVS